MADTNQEKIIFEYDCVCFFGSSYKFTLFEDGRLIRDERDFTSEIIKSPDLAKEIQQLIDEDKEKLNKLPGHVSNRSILDGASETFQFGSLKFSGANILTVSMEGYKKKFKENDYPVQGWEEDLLHFQRLFRKFRKKFREYVNEPLFNGERR